MEKKALSLFPIHIFITLFLIRMYQKVLSPKLGNRCVFSPSCSDYAELAILKYGLFNGLKKTLSRQD